MPGDLKDPEQFAPYHYDERFTEDPSIFDHQDLQLNDSLQSIALEVIGKKLSPEKLSELISVLSEKGYLHRNSGEESFRNEVKNQIKSWVRARRVLSRWLKI